MQWWRVRYCNPAGKCASRFSCSKPKQKRSLWAHSYQQDLGDVLTLQGEVASAIVNEIQVKLTPVEKLRLATARTVDPGAYRAYSYGRYYWNKRSPADIQQAIEYFKRAIANDPTYAP